VATRCVIVSFFENAFICVFLLCLYVRVSVQRCVFWCVFVLRVCLRVYVCLLFACLYECVHLCVLRGEFVCSQKCICIPCTLVF